MAQKLKIPKSEIGFFMENKKDIERLAVQMAMEDARSKEISKRKKEVANVFYGVKVLLWFVGFVIFVAWVWSWIR